MTALADKLRALLDGGAALVAEIEAFELLVPTPVPTPVPAPVPAPTPVPPPAPAGLRIEFPASPSAVVNGRYQTFWGHMHTLGLDDFDALDAADYQIEPKTTRFSYSLDPTVTGPMGLLLSLHGSSAPAQAGHVFRQLAPPTPDMAIFCLPNTTGKTTNGNKWDWYIHSGSPDKAIKPRSNNCTIAAIEYLRAKYPQINTAVKGIWIGGQSMGAVGALAKSLSLPDGLRKDIVVVSGVVGFNIFRKFLGSGSRTWAGPDSEHWAKIDMRERAEDPITKDIFYSATSTTTDGVTAYDPDFTAALQQHKIPHRFIYSSGTHGTPILNAGAASKLTGTGVFDSAECGRDNVTPFPAFTASTADWQTPQHGYFNLGLSWHHAQTEHSADRISLPVRYRAVTGIGGGFQDQPASATVTVTPRKLHGLSIEGWTWAYADQSGVVIDGSARITMQSGDAYMPIVFTKTTAEPPAPPPVEPPPPPPEPGPDVGVGVIRREPVSLSSIVNFDGLHDRYERHQRMVLLDGTVPGPAKVRITGADLSSGGLYRTLKAPSYTLTFVPLTDLEATPHPVGSVTLAAPVNYTDISVDLTNITPGWYKMGLTGVAAGESVFTGFCRVIKSKPAESVDCMPVVRGSHSRVGIEPNVNVWSVVPAKYAPKAVPLTRVIDETKVPDPALKRPGLHCDFIVPVRWSDTHRPNVDRNGVMSTFDAQAYHWGQFHARVPTVPCLDGKRGVGAVTMATHLEVGEALVPVAGNPAWPQTESGFYRVANLYFCDPWRFGKIRQDGTVITLVGWRHKGGMLGHWEDGDKGYQGLLGGLELVGDWSAIPEDRRGFWELWGCAWDRRRSGAFNVGAPSTDPREKGLIPHPPGGGMVTFHPDTQHNRIIRCEFPHDTHFDYNKTKVTEFLTGLQDPWDCVGEDGVLYVSERKSHRICAYSMDTGELLRVVVQGLPMATVNVNREVITSGTLDQRRAAPCVAPEGLYLQDGWLYFASKAQAQVNRVHLTTGELQVVRPIHIDGNSKYAKLALSDGTFGPRGSTFTWTWSNAQYGGPEMYGPPGADGSPAKQIIPWWEHQSGGTGNWTTHGGYGTAGCAQFGRMATASMVEGVKLISKSMPGDKPMSAAAVRGRTEYQRKALNLIHGSDGFGYYGIPLPWGQSADIDAFFTEQGHTP